MRERTAVGLRYCGGCNPRFDRVALVREAAARFPEADFVPASPGTAYPAVLVVCGCPVRCADTGGLAVPPDRLICLCGSEDLPRAEEQLAAALSQSADRPGTNEKESVNKMSWKDYYQQHLTTAEEAVTHIKSGDRVVVQHACGEPSYLLDAMTANAAAYENVEVVHMVAKGKSAYCAPEMAPHFHHNSLFVGPTSRDAVAEGRSDFTPCFFSEVPGFFDSVLPVDVALVTVTPPDEDGKCSLGVSVDYTLAAVKHARTVIAQVNAQMPFTCGPSVVDVTDIDCFVPHDAPIIPLAPPKIGPVEEAIGQNVASLIRDGDTLQLGIGAIPDAVLLFLKDKKDLGIHSEMFSDGVVELAKAGVITNAKKTLHPGKYVATFLMGTQRLYDFADHNPDVYLSPVDYVNDPFVIAQNDNMVSINSCVQVDLMGQVASESIGSTQISGTGGQVDFIRGAAHSRGGRAIIAMPATAKGKISKIVPLLDAGAAVTTGRCDVDYVVTEYGVAQLKGRTLRERARALIEIAHPDFRPELEAEYERRFHAAY